MFSISMKNLSGVIFLVWSNSLLRYYPLGEAFSQTSSFAMYGSTSSTNNKTRKVNNNWRSSNKSNASLNGNKRIHSNYLVKLDLKVKGDDDELSSNLVPSTALDEGKSDNPLLYFTTLLPLLLVYISNQWSRSSIYYLVNFADGASERTASNMGKFLILGYNNI